VERHCLTKLRPRAYIVDFRSRENPNELFASSLKILCLSTRFWIETDPERVVFEAIRQTMCTNIISESRRRSRPNDETSDSYSAMPNEI
jgi:hypothetical protein